jgi:hypothetical protein
VSRVVLATLNLIGSGIGRPATWVFQSMLLIAGGFITAGQVFALHFVRSAFEKSGDEALARVDVKALMDAATRAFPHSFRMLVAIRFSLVTVGSLIVMVLLLLPSASRHYP